MGYYTLTVVPLFVTFAIRHKRDSLLICKMVIIVRRLPETINEGAWNDQLEIRVFKSNVAMPVIESLEMQLHTTSFVFILG